MKQRWGIEKRRSLVGMEQDGECHWRQVEADEVLTLNALHCSREPSAIRNMQRGGEPSEPGRNRFASLREP